MEKVLISANLRKDLYDLAKIHKINLTEAINEALEKKLENYETLQQKKEKLEKELKEVEEVLKAKENSKELDVIVNELRLLKDPYKAKKAAAAYVDMYKLTIKELCNMAGYN